MSDPWIKTATGTSDGMHAHDKTLLSKMGFNDKDRKTPRHDLACLYLTQPDIANSILGCLNVPNYCESEEELGLITITSTLEYHLQKGSGQYATTIGFLDVVYSVVWHVTSLWERVEVWKNGRYVWEVRQCNRKRTEQGRFFAEVKIEPVGYGEILRQLNLYKSYFPSRLSPGVLITAWVMPDYEKAAIEAQGYTCLHLGPKFDSWVETINQKSKTSASGL